jgi:NADH-quinone oxidoreductase subunit G
VSPSPAQKNIAATLSEAEQALVLGGLIAGRHKSGSAIRALCAAIGELTGARFGVLSEGANSAGGHLAGVLPHRQHGGDARAQAGLHALAMLAAPLHAVLLFGLEPDADLTCSERATDQLAGKKFVAAFTPYVSESLERAANLMLPIGTFAETAGTFVNCEGRWQSFTGIATPVGDSRPGWKVLRVVGNLLDADGFDYMSSEEVRDELLAEIGELKPDNRYAGTSPLQKPNGADMPADLIDVPIYQVDAVVRRAAALQLTPEAERSRGDHS